MPSEFFVRTSTVTGKSIQTPPRGVRADIYIFLENVATLVPQALERERERVILVNVIEPRGRFGSQVDFGEKNAYLLCQVAESRNKS